LGFKFVEAKKFFSFIPIQTSPGAYSASCTMGTEALSPGVKRLGRGTDNLYSPSTEVKNEQSYTSIPICACMACYEETFTLSTPRVLEVTQHLE
jgi:hypothetical protein